MKLSLITFRGEKLVISNFVYRFMTVATVRDAL